MTPRRPGSGRKLVPAALLVVACTPNPCPNDGKTNDAGMRCVCRVDFNDKVYEYCDPDIGNPCQIGCFNPREADGGRQFMGADPVCLC